MTSNEINIEKVFLILRMHARLIAATLALGVFIAAAVTYQMPKMYRAATLLNFEFNSHNPLENQESGLLFADSYITTQIGILSSVNVAQHVVDSLSDYEKQRLRAALIAGVSTIDKLNSAIKRFIKSLFMTDNSGRKNAGDGGRIGEEGNREGLPTRAQYDALAKWLRIGLKITPMPNSRIVEVSYYSTDPKIAAFMADKVAKAYIATNLKMVTDPAYGKKVWFDEQLKSLRTSLEEAQAKLTAYQQQKGIVSSDERIDLETSRLRNLADQLVQAQDATRNAETMQQKLNDVLISGASLVTFEPVFNNAVVQNVKAVIRELEGQLVESSSSLGRNHPKIIELRSELSGARSRLNKEIQSITDGIENGTDLAKQREKSIEQAKEKQKELVLKLKAGHDRIAILQREVESARETYNAALTQLNTTSMLSMVNQTNVSIVDYAHIPSKHATPKVIRNLAIGVFGGLILGVGIALFRGVLIRKIHSEEDLISWIGVPLLGHLK